MSQEEQLEETETNVEQPDAVAAEQSVAQEVAPEPEVEQQAQDHRLGDMSEPNQAPPEPRRPQTAEQTNITSVGTLDSLTVTGNITANGNIVGDDETDITNIETIECDNIVHDGDTYTKNSFTTDQIDFVAGGATFLRLDEQGSTDTITFNTSNSDIDFVVNADGQSNIINVVGSNGFVGIN